MKISIEQVGKQSLERAELLLAGFPGAVDKALRSAISRTAQRVRSQSSKRIRERYAISAANLRMEENARISYSYSPGEGMEAAILFKGRKIPLHRYDGASPAGPTYDPGSKVPVHTSSGWIMASPGVQASGHQLRSTSPKKFEDAFVARFRSGHTGIFERTGGVTATGRDEIRELMGSSIPQMLGSDEVTDALSNDAGLEFDKRMTHEVDAILNGWR